MSKSSAALLLFSALLLCSVTLARARAANSDPSPWKTLSGKPPSVVARGGFSGLFPDSSYNAYKIAQVISVPDVILWCDVQLTKDGAGICFADLNLENSSTVSQVFPNRKKIYLVNGVPTEGYFPIDFTVTDLMNITLIQGVYSRSKLFDDNGAPILTVEEVMQQIDPAPLLWLNIQHDAFYEQHNLSVKDYVASTAGKGSVTHISSPEITFLRSISPQFRKTKEKLVFRFLSPDLVEPLTNQTYGFLLKNLTRIREFSSGILVPKGYIWPEDGSGYLLPHTSLVSDAHRIGLEVYAADFANDLPISYNYSFDPLAEYLQYVDNGEFSVDGVVSDFPITPSAAIECFSHLNKSDPGRDAPLVISYYGASGDYPPCTDIAYSKAISDGANIIDCPVQVSMDRIPICMSSANLIDSTTIVSSNFSRLAKKIPEIQPGEGIFSFDLTWAQIQTLTPQISNPYSKFELMRNPKSRNAGRFLRLSEFLGLAKGANSVSGALISIENAAYLMKQGLDVISAVLNVLSSAGINKRILIQSSNSSVLAKMKDGTKYERVYKVAKDISGATDSTIEDIKRFANAVVVTKESVLPTDGVPILTNATNVVERFHAAKLPVYVEVFSNEFLSQAYDFFSDATVEINAFVMAGGVDGIITGFPKTTASYKRNRCLGLGEKTPAYMRSVMPGGLLQLVPEFALPPAEAPLPELTPSDVNEPPLPPISRQGEGPASSPGGGTYTAVPPTSGELKTMPKSYPSTLAILLVTVACLLIEQFSTTGSYSE